MSGRTIDSQTTQVAQDNIARKVVDGILDGNLITSLILSNARKWTGEKMKKNLKYAKSTAMGWYTGMGDFNVTQQKTRVQMESTPASMYGSVTLPYFEIAVNKSQPVVQQEALEMQSAGDDLLDNLGTSFYSDGTSNQCDGLANIVDDGSVAATYRGLTRSSYDALDADVSTSVGSITLDTIGASIDAATVGSEEPDIIITTFTLWRAIEDLLFPSVTATYGAAGSKRGKINRLGDVGAGQALTGLAGYTAIYYRGIPIVKDAKCTSGYIYYLNRKFLFWAGLSHPKHGMVSLSGDMLEGVDNMVPKNHGISWSGFKEPINQDGETGQFIMYGQLICDSPRHQAVDQGATA